ncbi:MAG: glutathione peroxidase [Ferruginibacter sp.]|nr:glutathione peroxidase [Ferruginibacter sp.]
MSCIRPSDNSIDKSSAYDPMSQTTNDTAKSVHNFKVASIDGDVIDFSAFKGKKILIVNTASQCGYTPQYKELEALYQKYKDKLVVVGFPANNFGQQEPGTNSEIKTFCQKNYGVSFPMASKISVKGNDTAPIYSWLTQKKLNGVMDANIKWNFNKFLLDEAGQIIEKYDSGTQPMSEEITKRL